MFDMLAEARRQELQAREMELTQRMHWYDARTVDRMERALSRARARLRLGGGQDEPRAVAPPTDLLRPGGGSVVGGAS